MSKKDYIVLARAINKAKSSLSYASVNMGETNRSVWMVAESIAYELKLNNAKFDEKKFITACGL